MKPDILTKMMKKGINKSLTIVCVAILSVIAVSCSDKYCDPIFNHVEEFCSEENEQCIIELSQIYVSNWDLLYVFDSMMDPKEISKKIGFDCTCEIVPEGKRLVLFIADGSIVEKYLTDCYRLSFVDLNVNGIVEIERSKSTFSQQILG